MAEPTEQIEEPELPAEREIRIAQESEVPSCLWCKHARGHAFGACAAFPEGIPVPIGWGENRHTEPYPGDHGLRYEYDPEATPDDESGGFHTD